MKILSINGEKFMYLGTALESEVIEGSKSMRTVYCLRGIAGAASKVNGKYIHRNGNMIYYSALRGDLSPRQIEKMMNLQLLNDALVA